MQQSWEQYLGGHTIVLGWINYKVQIHNTPNVKYEMQSWISDGMFNKNALERQRLPRVLHVRSKQNVISRREKYLFFVMESVFKLANATLKNCIVVFSDSMHV